MTNVKLTVVELQKLLKEAQGIANANKAKNKVDRDAQSLVKKESSEKRAKATVIKRGAEIAKKETKIKGNETHKSLPQILSILKKQSNNKIELSSVFKNAFFNLNLINANLSASELKAVLTSRGSYALNAVVNSLYRIKVQIELQAINQMQPDFEAQKQSAVSLVEGIESQRKLFAELTTKKENDAKNVSLIRSQVENKTISESEGQDRLAKYTTQDKLKFVMLQNLGAEFTKVLNALRPNVTPTQFANYSAIVTDIDMLDSLVNNAQKLSIEVAAQAMAAAAQTVEVVEVVNA